jgi:hypothetical protein
MRRRAGIAAQVHLDLVDQGAGNLGRTRPLVHVTEAGKPALAGSHALAGWERDSVAYASRRSYFPIDPASFPVSQAGGCACAYAGRFLRRLRVVQKLAHELRKDVALLQPITVLAEGGRRREIIVPTSAAPQDSRPIRAETRAKLVASIARGRRWLDEIVAGTVTDVEQIAARESCSVRKVNMTISLAFLAPDLIKAAIEGRLPRGLGVVRLCDSPAEWSRQYQMLGLTSPYSA